MKTKIAIWISIYNVSWAEGEEEKYVKLFKKSYIEVNNFNGEINLIEEENIKNQEYLLFDGFTWKIKKRREIIANIRQLLKEMDDPFIILNNLDDDAFDEFQELDREREEDLSKYNGDNRKYDDDREYPEQKYYDQERKYDREYLEQKYYDQERKYDREYLEQKYYDQERKYDREYLEQKYYDQERKYDREYLEQKYYDHERQEGLQRVRNRHSIEKAPLDQGNNDNNHIKKYLFIVIKLFFFLIIFLVINFIYN